MQLLSPATDAQASPNLCAEQLLDALPPVMRVVRQHMRSNRSKGLSVPQFRSMVLLRDQPSASLSDVADFLGASLPTTSRMVTCLVSKGFVTRVHCRNDRRRVRLALTQRGITALEKSRAATSEVLSRELASLNEEQRRTILGALGLLESLFASRVVTGA